MTDNLKDGYIRRGLFGRFYIFHQANDLLAWSGMRWVSCTEDGLPTPPDRTQVCNFDTTEDAQAYIEDSGA
jgi:hypothetical protein